MGDGERRGALSQRPVDAVSDRARGGADGLRVSGRRVRFRHGRDG